VYNKGALATVLILEDYPPLRKLVSVVVRQLSHEAFPVANVGMALAINQWFDCLVADVDLPDGNGVEVAAKLLASGRVGAVVFYTASRDAELLRHAAELGLVVDKAAGIGHLVAAIERSMGRRLAAAVGDPAATTSGATVPHRSGTRRIR